MGETGQKKRQYKQIQQRLNKENRRVLEDIAVYFHSSDVKEKEITAILLLLAKRLLEGQRQHKSAKDVLGNDLKALCDGYILAAQKKSREQTLLETAESCLLGLGVLWLIEVFFTGSWRFPFSFTTAMPITQGFVLSMVLILAFAFSLYASMTKRPPALHNKNKRRLYIALQIIGYTLFWVCILLVKLLLREQVLVWVPIWLPFLLLLALGLFLLVLCRWQEER